jgi:hypothetical protein
MLKNGLANVVKEMVNKHRSRGKRQAKGMFLTCLEVTASVSS